MEEATREKVGPQKRVVVRRRCICGAFLPADVEIERFDGSFKAGHPIYDGEHNVVDVIEFNIPRVGYRLPCSKCGGHEWFESPRIWRPPPKF